MESGGLFLGRNNLHGMIDMKFLKHPSQKQVVFGFTLLIAMVLGACWKVVKYNKKYFPSVKICHNTL